MRGSPLRQPTSGVGSYRVLPVILNTAVADELIVRDPCRVRGAGQDHSAERLIATVAQVAALADAVDERLRALVKRDLSRPPLGHVQVTPRPIILRILLLSIAYCQLPALSLVADIT